MDVSAHGSLYSIDTPLSFRGMTSKPLRNKQCKHYCSSGNKRVPNGAKRRVVAPSLLFVWDVAGILVRFGLSGSSPWLSLSLFVRCRLAGRLMFPEADRRTPLRLGALAKKEMA